MHVAFLALHKFSKTRGALPGPRYVYNVYTCTSNNNVLCMYVYVYRNAADADDLVQLAEQVNSELKLVGQSRTLADNQQLLC